MVTMAWPSINLSQYNAPGAISPIRPRALPETPSRDAAVQPPCCAYISSVRVMHLSSRALVFDTPSEGYPKVSGICSHAKSAANQ